LGQELRQFFVPYFAHVLRLSIEILGPDSTVAGLTIVGQPRQQLQQHVVVALGRCFQYDEEGFMTKDRFKGLYGLLVDQLERGAGEEAAAYRARAQQQLAPTLAHLAVCVGDEARWKELHAAVLLKCQHADHHVKWASLVVIKAFFDQLGESFNNLIPETVGTVTELMHDDHEDVERMAQDVCQVMESCMGESLSRRFRGR
jgi:U3 small nucleolar RNA-associated protein 10